MSFELLLVFREFRRRLWANALSNNWGNFIVTLFGITFLTFCLTYLAPGDPVTMLLETADTIVSQELIDETRAQLGLDKPFVVQYANWVVNAAQGDLGMSYSAKKPVVDRMLEALPGTLMLAGTA